MLKSIFGVAVAGVLLGLYLRSRTDKSGVTSPTL